MSAQDKATKFEAGKVYFARSIGDYDSIAKIKVVKVTAKMVTFVYHGETIRRKIDQRENRQRVQVCAGYAAYSSHAIEEEAVEVKRNEAEESKEDGKAAESNALEIQKPETAQESAHDYRYKEILITMHCYDKGHKVARLVSMSMFSIPDYDAADGLECNVITEDEIKRVELIKQWIVERANDQHESILEFVKYEIVEAGTLSELDLNRQLKLDAEKQSCEPAAEVAAEAVLGIEEPEDAEARPVDGSESKAKKLAIAAEIIGWQAFKDGKKCVPALDRNLDSLLENLPAGTGLAIMIYKRWARGWTDANLAAPVVCEEETSETEAAQMESEGPEEAKTSLTIESAMTIDSVDEGLLEANGVWGGEFRGQWKYKILHKNEKFFRSSDRGLALGHAISAYNSIPIADRVGTKEEAYNKINKARYDRLDAIWGLSSMDELSGMMQKSKALSGSLFNSALNGMDARPFSVAMNRSVRNRLSVGYVGETIADLAFYTEERAKIEAMAE